MIGSFSHVPWTLLPKIFDFVIFMQFLAISSETSPTGQTQMGNPVKSSELAARHVIDEN